MFLSRFPTFLPNFFGPTFFRPTFFQPTFFSQLFSANFFQPTFFYQLFRPTFPTNFFLGKRSQKLLERMEKMLIRHTLESPDLGVRRWVKLISLFPDTLGPTWRALNQWKLWKLESPTIAGTEIPELPVTSKPTILVPKCLEIKFDP